MDDAREFVAEMNPEALFADGFDDALIGYVRRCSQPTLALYDYARCVQILVRNDGMSEEDADEFLEFNTLGAWVGKDTPAFAFLRRRPQITEDDGCGWDLVGSHDG